MVDGGVVANNPAELGINEIQTIWPDKKLDLVLSVGTGITTDTSSPSDDLVHWIRKFVDLSTSPHTVHNKLLHTKDLNYYRVNPTLARNISLDETDVKKLDMMVADVKGFLDSEAGVDSLTRVSRQIFASCFTLIHQEVSNSLKASHFPL